MMLRKYEYIHDFHPQWDSPLKTKSSVIVDTDIRDSRGYAIVLYISDPTDYGRFCDLVEDWLRAFAQEIV